MKGGKRLESLGGEEDGRQDSGEVRKGRREG